MTMEELELICKTVKSCFVIFCLSWAIVRIIVAWITASAMEGYRR